MSGLFRWVGVAPAGAQTVLSHTRNGGRAIVRLFAVAPTHIRRRRKHEGCSRRKNIACRIWTNCRLKRRTIWWLTWASGDPCTLRGWRPREGGHLSADCRVREPWASASLSRAQLYRHPVHPAPDEPCWPPRAQTGSWVHHSLHEVTTVGGRIPTIVSPGRHGEPIQRPRHSWQLSAHAKIRC